MSVYLISQLTITDVDSYAKYQDAFEDVFKKFAGTILSVDDDAKILIGDCTASRIVLLEFPDTNALKEWLYSEEYQAIGQYRDAGSSAVSMVVRQGVHMELEKFRRD